MRIPGTLAAAAVLVSSTAVLTGATTTPTQAKSPTARAPEADLAYHGHASMTDGRLDVRLTPRNHGPSAVTDATVRLRWSAALTDRQRLPQGCVRAGARTVLCGTGELAADAVGKEISLRVRLKGTPSEALMEIDTVWTSGGSVDNNHQNDRQRVLALDTGDTYYF